MCFTLAQFNGVSFMLIYCLYSAQTVCLHNPLKIGRIPADNRAVISCPGLIKDNKIKWGGGGLYKLRGYVGINQVIAPIGLRSVASNVL